MDLLYAMPPLPSLASVPALLDDVIRSARSGEAAGIGGLYDRCAARLLRIAWRLTGNEHNAEDVVHDVFVGLPEALARYDERGSFDTWLAQVTARTALMRVRASSRHRESGLADASTVPSRVHSDHAAEYSGLERQIAGLPETLRAVFVLSAMEGFTHDEIAALLDISSGASRVRLARALAYLRTRLRPTPSHSAR